MIRRSHPLQTPLALLFGEPVIRSRHPAHPVGQWVTRGQLQHRCPVETIAKDLQCRMVTGLLPAQFRDAQQCEVHLLSPTRLGLSPQFGLQLGR